MVDLQKSAMSNIYTVLLIVATVGVPLLLYLGSSNAMYGFLGAILSFGILLSYFLYCNLLDKRG